MAVTPMRRPVLAITAAASAGLFAVASWLVIALWAHPRMIAQLKAFADQGMLLELRTPSVLHMTLPYLTIAIAELGGAIGLVHPKLRSATLLRRTGWLASAIALGMLVALIAFVPPGITSVLVFLPPVMVLMLLCWLVAAPLGLLLRRRSQDVPDSSGR
jgi:hypothetical protein